MKLEVMSPSRAHHVVVTILDHQENKKVTSFFFDKEGYLNWKTILSPVQIKSVQEQPLMILVAFRNVCWSTHQKELEEFRGGVSASF